MNLTIVEFKVLIRRENRHIAFYMNLTIVEFKAQNRRVAKYSACYMNLTIVEFKDFGTQEMADAYRI